MQARMNNPALVIPGAMDALLALGKATRNGSVPSATLELVHLRASQINGRSFCVDFGVRSAKKAGETDERLFAVAAWRETPYFTEAERAALALTEAVTRLADRADPVPDAIWDEATRHYDEQGLASIGADLSPSSEALDLQARSRARWSQPGPKHRLLMHPSAWTTATKAAQQGQTRMQSGG